MWSSILQQQGMIDKGLETIEERHDYMSRLDGLMWKDFITLKVIRGWGNVEKDIQLPAMRQVSFWDLVGIGWNARKVLHALDDGMIREVIK